MNIAEVPLLLAALGQFQFVEASDVAVQMWAEALDDDMPVEFALKHVAAHYGKATAEPLGGLIPGNLNRAWRDESAARRAVEQRSRPISAPVADGVPMPDYVRRAWQEALSGTRMDGSE